MHDPMTIKWILFAIATIFFIVANVLDVVTTNQALKEGSGTEGNPAMAYLMKLVGGWRGAWWLYKVVALLALLGGTYFYRHNSWMIMGLIFVLLAFDMLMFAYVIPNNVRIDDGNP